MPWKEQSSMEQREKFVMEYFAGQISMTALCRRFGVSRKTGYKWLQRFLDAGVPGLMDRSRAPLSHPHAVDTAKVDAIVSMKERYPSWGPKKLLARLTITRPEVDWPSESTIARLMRRRGLVQERRRRRRTPAAEHRLATAHEPNQVWCADFKGKFRAGRRYTHPLTITDAKSRYVLCCHDTGGENLLPTQEAFKRTFLEYGLPLRIRSDNGTPFASTAIGGLSRLSIWWVKLGILPERTRPGHPQDNGSHERMHRTLKTETAKPARPSPEEQQTAFDAWRHEFNQERPHEALGMATPASVYHRSPRSMPEEPGDPEYPDHFEVRRIHRNGRLKFRGQFVGLGAVLGTELVGIEPVDDCHSQLWFGPIHLGLITEQANRTISLVTNNPYPRNQQ